MVHQTNPIPFWVSDFLFFVIKGREPGRVAALKKQCGTLFLAARALRAKQGQSVFAEGKDGESLMVHHKKQVTTVTCFLFYIASLSLPLNNAGIAHTDATPTMVYTILESRLPPPNIKATRSKFKMPISPQLIPPIISSARHTLYNVFKISFLSSLKCYAPAVDTV